MRGEPFDATAIRGFLGRHGVEAGELAIRNGAEGEGPSIYVTDPEGTVVELKGGPTPASAGDGLSGVAPAQGR